MYTYGYIRVSSRDQNEDRQRIAMREAGVFVPPAIYPAVPKGSARLRFCVTAAHKPEQIAEALAKLDACAKEHGIQLPE